MTEVALKEKTSERMLLMGNEAFARGAWEAGVKVATAYPGTPSTEILEAVSEYPDIYCEWAPNEKVALEVAIGAAMTGARVVCTMKHVGLNVAADPLMTVTYTGIRGGLVLIVADDPGMHSSQNEQDTRNYARFAKIPILEPSDSQEAKDFVGKALDISERFDTPVIVRSTTRISHTKTVVQTGPRVESGMSIEFEKNPKKYVPVPMNARPMHVKVEERLKELEAFAEETDLNPIFEGSSKTGILTSCTAYQYVREFFPEANVFKLSLSYPLPVKRIQEFASKMDRMLVVEELDPFFETELRAKGIHLEGKELLPMTGEFSPDTVKELHGRIEGNGPAKTGAERPAAEGLPVRAPVLCPGCPHRGLFYALSQMDVIVTGDIGCYSLGFAPPYNRMDTIICMGASVGVMHGMGKAGLDKPVVGVIGDSTFLHSGVTGLMDVVYNKGTGTLVILDNRTTAMTGHQDHPATGKTLMGEEAYEVSFADLARACGVKRVATVDPYDIDTMMEILKREIEAPEPSVIVTTRACALLDRTQRPHMEIDEEKCKGCLKCIKLGCPALETYEVNGKKKVRVNPVLCMGCEMCKGVCPFECISDEEAMA
jgi:indolepyruvate ferredoxin oxidoreductase alpha subunit